MIGGGGCGLMAMRRRRPHHGYGREPAHHGCGLLGGAGGFECFRLENQRLGGEVVHHAHGKTAMRPTRTDENIMDLKSDMAFPIGDTLPQNLRRLQGRAQD